MGSAGLAARGFFVKTTSKFRNIRNEEEKAHHGTESDRRRKGRHDAGVDARSPCCARDRAARRATAHRADQDQRV